MADETPPKKSNTLPLAIGIAVVVLAGVGYLANQAQQKNTAEMQATAPQAAATEPSADAPPADAATTATQTDAAQQPAVAGPGNPVIAKVNGKDVLKSDVDAFLATVPEQMKQIPADQLFTLAQEQVVTSTILDAKIAGSDIASSQEYKDKLAEVEKQLARGIFMQRELEKSVTEEAIKKAYDEHVSKLPKIEETKASHILLKDEAKAKEVIEKLNAGAKFEDLAKELSEDKASDTGDLGYFAKTDMVPEFAEAAFSMAPGSLSKEPVKTQFGWHVIKIADRRVRPTPELKELRPVLESEVRRQNMEKLMKDLRAGATVELFDATGKPVSGAAPTESEAAPTPEAAPQSAPEAQPAQ